MKGYKIKGKFLIKNNWQSFTKEVIGKNKKDAKERILSIMGGRHKLKRTMITIDTIKEVKPEDIEDPVVKYIVER
jgi:large subunit ribosomal protein LX